MKRSTLIIISVIYVASIVFISFFGLRAKVYNEEVPVTEIVITNETDRYATGSNGEQIKKLYVEFDTAGSYVNGVLSGTYINVIARALPDNATNTTLQYIYDKAANPYIELVTLPSGRVEPIVLFKNRGIFTLTIKSTDGRGVVAEVVLQAY